MHSNINCIRMINRFGILRNIMKTSILFISFLIILTTVGGLYFVSQQRKNKTVTTIIEKAEGFTDSVNETTKQIPIQQNPASETVLAEETQKDYNLEEGAWIANWDQSNGMKSYDKNPSRYKSISPTWYTLNSDLNLGTKTGAKNTTILTTLNKNSSQIIPTIASGDAEVLSRLLNNEQARQSFIQQIRDEVINNSYDGIDIDFESIKSTDKDKFSLFIQELSETLHSSNKLLSIAVLPKDSDLFDSLDLTGVGGFESRKAQDWEALGKSVDQFRIMAYDYTHSYESAGPISPSDWIQDILKFATTKIDKEKIYLGLPLYAYIWKVDTKGADALIYSQVINKINSADKIIQNDLISDKGEKYLKYTKDGQIYEIWYQDEEVNNLRLDIAKEFEIKGVYYWRLGGDNL